jgi:hypothetical protein
MQCFGFYAPFQARYRITDSCNEPLIRVISNFFRKFAEIFASQGAPPVLTTPMANLAPASTTPGANFATGTAGIVDTSGKLPPM